jgi:excisionase family DNA binding protein
MSVLLSEANARKRLMSVEEARHDLGIGRTKFYELVKFGRLKTIKIGRLRKVTPEAIETLIASLVE